VAGDLQSNSVKAGRKTEIYKGEKDSTCSVPEDLSLNQGIVLQVKEISCKLSVKKGTVEICHNGTSLRGLSLGKKESFFKKEGISGNTIDRKEFVRIIFHEVPLAREDWRGGKTDEGETVWVFYRKDCYRFCRE